MASLPHIRGFGEEAVEELSSTTWLSPAIVAEVLRRAREAKK